jgi:hypothetical protein
MSEARSCLQDQRFVAVLARRHGFGGWRPSAGAVQWNSQIWFALLGRGNSGMRQVLITFANFRRAAGIALLGLSTLSAAPASAQDIFGSFFRLFSAPAQRAPVFEHPHAPRVFQPRKIRPRPKVVRADAPAIKTPIKARARPKVVRVDAPESKTPVKPKSPGEVTDPLPELLADSTLRRGDIVMFPDGPRVFNGRQGTKHALTDFVPVSRAGNVVPRSTRKLLAGLYPGRNGAWNAGQPKLADSASNVEATGTLKSKRR